LKGLTYTKKRKRQRVLAVDLATCTLFKKKYGEMSLWCTIHILSPQYHVGRRGRSFKASFAKTSYSSRLGGLCTGQTSVIDLRERHRTWDIGGMITIVGHVSWAPRTIWVNTQIPKGPKSREDHAWGVYGTFGYDTRTCSLEALRPVRVRVSRGRLHAWHVNT